jgi:hypothetical protein
MKKGLNMPSKTPTFPLMAEKFAAVDKNFP